MLVWARSGKRENRGVLIGELRLDGQEIECLRVDIWLSVGNKTRNGENHTFSPGLAGNTLYSRQLRAQRGAYNDYQMFGYHSVLDTYNHILCMLSVLQEVTYIHACTCIGSNRCFYIYIDD
jgi:hypothetical protein